MAKDRLTELWTVKDLRFICENQGFYERDILLAMVLSNWGRWVDIFLGDKNIGHLILKSKVKTLKDLVDSIENGADFSVGSSCFCEENCKVYLVIPDDITDLTDGVFQVFANKRFFCPNISYDTPIPEEYADFYNSITLR